MPTDTYTYLNFTRIEEHLSSLNTTNSKMKKSQYYKMSPRKVFTNVGFTAEKRFNMPTIAGYEKVVRKLE